MAVMQKLVYMTKVYKQDALTKEIEGKFNILQEQYARSGGGIQQQVSPDLE